MNKREALQIDITSNHRRVCMYIRIEKLKITVLAGTLSSSSEIMSESFYFLFSDVWMRSMLPPFYRHFYRGCNFSGKNLLISR